MTTTPTTTQDVTTMTSAETVRTTGNRTEVIKASILQRGVIVIDDETGNRFQINTMQAAGQVIYIWFANHQHRVWWPHDMVTVVAESLPATYWIAKYERLQRNLAGLVAELTARAGDMATDHTEPPVTRVAKASVAKHSAGRIQGVLDNLG